MRLGGAGADSLFGGAGVDILRLTATSASFNIDALIATTTNGDGSHYADQLIYASADQSVAAVGTLHLLWAA